MYGPEKLSRVSRFRGPLYYKYNLEPLPLSPVRLPASSQASASARLAAVQSSFHLASSRLRLSVVAAVVLSEAAAVLVVV